MSKLLVLLAILTSLAAGLPIGDDNSFQPDPSQNDVLIHKQFYTHSGPESVSDRKAIFGKSKLNFKVVFVKIPSSYARFIQSGQKPLSVSLAPVEERLVLFVLTEKADKKDDLEIVNIETQTPIPPSPPEVHFIRYKDQQEAAEVQGRIIDQYEDLDSQ